MILYDFSDPQCPPPSTIPKYITILMTEQGRPQDLTGGGQEIIFFSDLEAMRFARGVRGHAPPRIFFKWCSLVRFGVYLDQILSLKYFKNYYFYINNLKIHVKIHINYSCTHMLGRSGAYSSCPEKILKMWCSLVRFSVYFDQLVS